MAYRELQKLKEESWTLYGSELGPLHICYGNVAWCVGGTPESGSGGVSDSLPCSWYPFIPTGLPHLDLL